LELQEPVVMVKGDRYIVRLPSPPTTVGGGIVVDPQPGRKHRRFRSKVVERLETLAEGSPSEILLQSLERRSPVPVRDLLERSGLGEQASDALAQLVDEGQAVPLTGDEDWASGGAEGFASSKQVMVSRAWWSRLMDRAADELSSYHQEFPLRRGMPREALRSGLRLTPKVFDAAMARAVAEGLLVDEGASVRLPSHTIELTAKQKQDVEHLLARFRRQPYATPSVKESVEALGEELLNVLLKRGDLVQVAPDVLFLPETYEQMVKRVRGRIEQEGSVTLSEVRDMFGSSRKYAQALLEHLDEKGVTKRVGDERVLR
jgi:selenocysteine-specific elongation factor